MQAVLGSTAAHGLGLIVKQLQSIGVPYLHDVLGMKEFLGVILDAASLLPLNSAE